MAAYVIVNIEIQDPTRYEEYKPKAHATVQAFGGRYIVRGGQVDVLEGRWTPRRVVVLEFPDRRAAHDWWNSSEYEDAKTIRQSCAYTEMIVVDGVPG